MNKRGIRVRASTIGEKARGVFLKKAAEEYGTNGREARPTGSVHSCFERVVNIVFPEDSGCGADCLIGLCRPGVPLSPLHLEIARQSAVSDLPVREGEPVAVTGRELVFPSLVIVWAEAKEYVTFFRRRESENFAACPFPAAQAVKELCARVVAAGLTGGPHSGEGLLPLIGSFGCDLEKRSLSDTWAESGCRLLEEYHAAAAKSVFSWTAARAVSVLERLSAAAAARRQELLFRAARDMLGLGPGLTPAGDDFLTGLMITDLAWRRRFPSAPALGEHGMWRRLAGEAAALTGAVSCQQLRLAAGGNGNEVFERVCWNMLQADEQVLSDIPVLARFGATSGLDYLAGVVFALRHLLVVCHG